MIGKPPSDDDVRALRAYLCTLEPPPSPHRGPDGELSEAALEHARAATIAPIHIRVEIAWPSQTRMCAPRSRR